MAKSEYVETKTPFEGALGRHLVMVNKHVDNLNGGEVAGFEPEIAKNLVTRGHGAYVVPEAQAEAHEARVKAAAEAAAKAAAEAAAKAKK